MFISKPTLTKKEQFLVDLLAQTPPLHYSDYEFIANLICLDKKAIEELRKDGYIIAINGYRTTNNYNVIDKSSRLKSGVITEALTNLVEWEDTHNFEECELEPDIVVEIFYKALQSGFVPYTDKYRERERKMILECTSSYSSCFIIEELEKAGIYIDYWDETNRTLYIHLNDDLKDKTAAMLRTCMINILRETVPAVIKTEIFTDDESAGTELRYYKLHRRHITLIAKPSTQTPYFSLIRSFMFFE